MLKLKISHGVSQHVPPRVAPKTEEGYVRTPFITFWAAFWTPHPENPKHESLGHHGFQFDLKL